ncbi:metallophosphoesterase family protein [Pediococcus cellicola]|uniref:Phosphoesterase n=1 Tax=Pediococcus cellicola TaxID=319652 RepID=A0A0R2INJ8_9LACO|nr:metallophosphoesterase family protein [Pediococcus cellicola]KRN64918.1 phosphoesterase [Pediococcus cellicola]GEL16055.1 metallophosphatase [Pediococcus cellicola]
MNFFTADTHFFHKDLLGYNDFAPRPFPSVEVMNETIIKNWNARVKPADTVYHLGDIALYFTHPAKLSNEAVFEVLKALNGHLILIKGNHDSRDLFKFLDHHNFILTGKPKFEFHDVGALIKLNHRQLYMTHYPMMMGIVKQIINLHGHIHHYSVNIKEDINVGVDTPEKAYLDYEIPFGTPFSETDIEKMIIGKREDFAKRG